MKGKNKPKDRDASFSGVFVCSDGKTSTITMRPSIAARIAFGGFFGVWLSGWTIGCGFLTYLLLTDFSWFHFAFTIPFYVGWLFGAGTCIYLLTCKQVIRLFRDSMEIVNTSCFRETSSRHVKGKEILQFRKTDNDGIFTPVLETSSESMTLLCYGNESQVDGLIEFILVQLGRLPNSSSNSNEDEMDFRIQPISKQPAKSSWAKQPGFAGQTSFRQLGKFEFWNTIMLMGVCLIWNGISVAFLCIPFFVAPENNLGGPEMTLIMLGIIPFAIIGLLILLAVIKLFLEPIRETTISFSSSEIERTTRYAGTRFFSKTQTFKKPVEISLLHTHDKRGKHFVADQTSEDGEKPFILDFREGTKHITKIKSLSYDEASWIATTLIDNYSIFNGSGRLQSAR